MYKLGLGVEKDHDIALEWYKKATEQDNNTDILNVRNDLSELNPPIFTKNLN